MTPVAWASTLLVVSTLIGLVALVVLYRRGRDGMRLRFWMLLTFLVSYQLSGFAHVLEWSRTRGYYEALAGAPPGSGSGLVPAALMTLVGTCTLVLGLSTRQRVRTTSLQTPETPYSWPRDHRVVSTALGISMTLVCGWALTKVMAVAAAAATTRIIAVGAGNARYVFLADWLPWGVALLALALWNVDRTAGADVANAWLMVTCLGMIAASQSWSGGRSSVLFACFPLLAVLLPRMGATRRLAMPLGAVGLIGYVAFQTSVRSKGAPMDLWGLADWQWGRFSMAAWADRYTHLFGFVHGETYLSGLIVVPLSILHFGGISVSSPFRPVVGLTGQYFLGSPEQIYIVPGSMAESFVNFGYLGVAVGYGLMGLAAAWLADRYLRSTRDIERLLIAALAAELLSQIVFQFEAFFQGAIMSLLPIWILWWVERRADRRRGRVST